MRRPPFTVLMAVALSSAAVARTANAADPQEQQLAQALFDEGRRLMEQAKYSDACPKLAESQRLDPAGGTLLNLALCHEKEGKLATAQSEYNEALTVAARDGRKDRQKIAHERLAAIDRFVPRLSIVVDRAASEVEGLELKLDRLAVRHAAWNVPTPIDPGTHLLEATAPGRTPWSQPITIDASQKKSIEVPVISTLAQLPSESESQPTRKPEALGTLAPPEVYVERSISPVTFAPSASRANPVYYAALGVTLVAVTAAAITGYASLSENAKARDDCIPDRRYCRTAAGSDAADAAAAFGWASTVSLAVAAAAGVTLLFVPSRVSAATRAASASGVPGGATFVLRGTF